MTKKGTLHLTIDNELIEVAKNNPLIKSLSAEFETWLRIRLQQNNNVELPKDVNMEIAKMQAEIERLKTLKEKEIENQQTVDLKIKIIDSVIDNMIEFKDNTIDPRIERINGLQFLLKRKLNLFISEEEAKAELIKRIKERNL